jgi:hypothetical protein
MALSSGARRRLRVGSLIGVGQEESWELADASPPRALGRNELGTIRLEENGMLSLPDEENPQAMVFRRSRGWVLEVGGEERPVASTSGPHAIGGQRWWLELPDLAEVDETAHVGDEAGSSLDDLELRLAVSLDQEQVDVTLVGPTWERVLPGRVHNTLLLVLARIRLSDRAQGLEEAECGWLHAEDAARQLGEDISQVNLYSHRARQVLGRMGVADASRLVERRSMTRQLRIGIARLEIESRRSQSDRGPAKGG